MFDQEKFRNVYVDGSVPSVTIKFPTGSGPFSPEILYQRISESSTQHPGAYAVPVAWSDVLEVANDDTDLGDSLRDAMAVLLDQMVHQGGFEKFLELWQGTQYVKDNPITVGVLPSDFIASAVLSKQQEVQNSIPESQTISIADGGPVPVRPDPAAVAAGTVAANGMPISPTQQMINSVRKLGSNKGLVLILVVVAVFLIVRKNKD